MRDLFDRLRNGNEGDIDDLIYMQMQESVTLDFKQKADSSSGAFDKIDKKTLAAAISGFANSGGGLLIWGVDARKNSDQIDCAQSAVPISDIRRFLSEATTLSGQLIQPKHDGIEFAIIESARKNNGGYLLMWVERSERRPHRSEAQDQKQYFKRAGDSFFPMEHYDIEDAFARNSVVNLYLDYAVRVWSSNDNDMEYHINIYLGNNTESVAKFPYVVVKEMFGCVLPIAGPQPFKSEHGLKNISLLGGVDDVVHPGTEKHSATFLARFMRSSERDWKNAFKADADEVSITLLFGCENGRAMQGQISLGRLAFGLDP